MPKNSKIWIDLDNSPHVPFFLPIVRELERNGHSVFLTTRDCFQVCSLADHFAMDHSVVGRHYGANKLAKILGTLWRSLQLAPLVLRERPDLSLSHGSRSLVILSSLLRIPSVLFFDYEHAKIIPFFKAELGVAPASIDGRALAKSFKRGVRGFSGLKEDVYVPSFRPSNSIRKQFGIDEHNILVLIRPPATEAHYHNPESDLLFSTVVDLLGGTDGLTMIILPRNEKTQRDLIFQKWPQWCSERKIIVPDQVVNGLDLIWQSDLVISGGGTMNREAAALGIPVYSIFRGRLGAVDRYLAEQGRLVLIETPSDVRAKIAIAKRSVTHDAPTQQPALNEIIGVLEELLQRT